MFLNSSSRRFFGFVFSLFALTSGVSATVPTLRAFDGTYATAKNKFSCVGLGCPPTTTVANLKQVYALEYINRVPANTGPLMTKGFVKNVAAIVLKNTAYPIKNAETEAFLDADLLQCKNTSGYLSKACSNLIHWPAMVRMFYLSENLGQEHSSFAISPTLRSKVLDYFWYILERSTTAFEVAAGNGPAGVDQTWADDSENHILTTQSMFYLAAQALANEDDYKDRPLLEGNGKTPTQMLEEWREHWDHYVDLRVKHGFFLEFNSAKYGKYTLAAVYNLMDFSEDSNLKSKLKNLLDLNFAMAASESLPNGMRGGSQSRKDPPQRAVWNTYTAFFRYYIKQSNVVTTQADIINLPILTSDYYPPEAVWEIWNKPPITSPYEVSARVPGVVSSANTKLIDPTKSVFRTTYVSPSFSLGSNLLDYNNQRYAKNGSEARSLAMYVNEGNQESIGENVPQIFFAPKEGQCFDQSYGVQKKNAMIYQNHIYQYLLNDPTIQNLRNCYLFNWNGTTTQETVIDHSLNPVQIPSTRIDQGIEYKPVFLSSDRMVEKRLNTVTQLWDTVEDDTRMQSDMEFSSLFSYALDPNRGVFLKSPAGSTFVWVKPLNSTFVVKPGYNPTVHTNPALHKQVREESYFVKDLVLTSDKFSPVAVVVAESKNFERQGGTTDSFETFKNEIFETSTLSYGNNKATLQQSMRSALQPRDIFLDSVILADSSLLPTRTSNPRNFHASNLSLSNWTPNESKQEAHNRHTLTSASYGAGLEFSFNVQTSGTYYLKARVRNASNIWIHVDSGGAFTAPLPGASQNLAWQDVKVFPGAVNRINLTQGAHTIRVLFRKEGVELDALVLLYERNDNPAVIEFYENLNRLQPLSLIDGTPINASPAHLTHTFLSPYVKSARDSGIWDIRSGTIGMVINGSGEVFSETQGKLIEAEGEVSMGSPIPAVMVDPSGTLYTQMSDSVSYRYPVTVSDAAANKLIIRSRYPAGVSTGVLKVSVNGGPEVVGNISSGTSWAWSTQSFDLGSLPLGAQQLSIKSNLEVDAFMLTK